VRKLHRRQWLVGDSFERTRLCNLLLLPFASVCVPCLLVLYPMSDHRVLKASLPLELWICIYQLVTLDISPQPPAAYTEDDVVENSATADDRELQLWKVCTQCSLVNVSLTQETGCSFSEARLQALERASAGTAVRERVRG
jgi:hypothetical protein